MKKRFIALATAAMCMAGNINTVFASRFADINDVPWPGAAQYIDEAASLGLMSGYTENGKQLCKARNNVTYNEAVQFMYSIMCSYNSANKTSAATISKWTSTMQANNIPTWAYESTAYALENGILSSSDLKIFMANASTQNNARREDVGVIFGKALSKIYQVNPSATVNYNDKSQISASSIPYLELLNRLNLMVGDENNNFNPKKNINRAEMAVLATKTYNELKGGSSSKPSNPTVNEQVIGTVTDISSSSITVNTGSTEKKVDVSSSVTVMYNGDSAKLSDINEGDNVVVVVNSGKATFITAYSSGSTSALTKGTISSISKSRITIQSGSRTASYKFDKDYNKVPLTLDGSSSKDVDDLIDLVDDGASIEASITADKNGYVTKITATTADSSLKGEMSYLSSSKITIKSGSKDYSYYLLDDTDDIKVTIDGSSSSYDKLKDKYDDGEKYTVTLTIDKDKEVTKIVAETSKGSLSGDMTYLSTSKITIKSSGKEKSYYLIDDTDDISVKIDGKTSDFDKLTDKYKDDEKFTVTLTLNSKDEVTKIDAKTGSSSTSSTSGSLYSLSSSTIKIKTSSGGTRSYDIAKDCTVTIDGSSSSVSRLKDRFHDDKQYDVKLTLNSKDEVTKISASLKETSSSKGGQIYSVDEDRIRIKTSDGYKSYYFASSGCDFTIDGKFASLRTVIDKYGDGSKSSVKAYVTVNGADRATKVKIETGEESSDSKTGEITYLSKSRIKIKLSNGDTKSYDLASSVSVYIDGKSSSVSKLEDKLDDDEKFEATLTLNSSGDVTKIKAEGTKSSVKGNLLSLDEDKIKVGEELSSGVYTGNSYYLAGSVTVVVDGDEKDLDWLIGHYPGRSYTVELSRNSSGNVTKIVAKEK